MHLKCALFLRFLVKKTRRILLGQIFFLNDLTLFFCDLNIPPRDTYTKTKISQKQKNFFGKIALNLYQKISKTKGNSFEHLPPPPGIRTQICQKTKAIPLNKKSPPTYVPQICRLLLLICQRKFMQKIWKFSLKNFFLKKNLFWGHEKGFFLGGNSQEKMFRSQKKASFPLKKKLFL